MTSAAGGLAGASLRPGVVSGGHGDTSGSGSAAGSSDAGVEAGGVPPNVKAVLESNSTERRLPRITVCAMHAPSQRVCWSWCAFEHIYAMLQADGLECTIQASSGILHGASPTIERARRRA